MRYRNKFNINLYNNPYKKTPELLSQKNTLEAQWYDKEAEEYFKQLNNSGELMLMDKEHEDWFAFFYDQPSDTFIYDKNYNYFERLPRQKPQRMLELGSGNGTMSRFFLRRGIDVFSVDISPKACLFLARSDPRSLPLDSCSEILPFKDESFDVVTSFLALHHFNLRLSFKEIWRVLKNDGVGVFIEPMCNSELFYKLRQLIPIPDNESPGGGGINKSELVKELEKVGFDYKMREFELLTRIERLPFFSRFQDWLRKIDYFILSRFPSLRRFARVIVLEIRKK
jgi:SAM-dependent methyltransferase